VFVGQVKHRVYQLVWLVKGAPIALGLLPMPAPVVRGAEFLAPTPEMHFQSLFLLS
jgi:hypothetical protein